MLRSARQECGDNLPPGTGLTPKCIKPEGGYRNNPAALMTRFPTKRTRRPTKMPSKFPTYPPPSPFPSKATTKFPVSTKFPTRRPPVNILQSSVSY